LVGTAAETWDAGLVRVAEGDGAAGLARIRARLLSVQQRMAEAALRAGRQPAEVTLVAVSKTHPPEAVAAAAEAGQSDFGENRVEEAAPKILSLGPRPGLRWHMIGRVQGRKARAVVEAGFALVHSVDSLRLAERLGRFAAEAGRRQPVLLECNTSGEASKAGFRADEPQLWAALLPDLRRLVELPGLEVRGLMTMAPEAAEPGQARPYFRRLQQFRDFLVKEVPAASWLELSMGMTDDFEVAIEAGATLVRVGRAIFGERR
jgi:pyridoxal phosphate enzyme (YggS family)